MTTELLATNPTLDGIKESIAKYWYTTPDQITIHAGNVFQARQLMVGFFVKPHHDGYKFIHQTVD